MRNSFVSFFFNDTATTEIYTLSLHDALPISRSDRYSASAAVSSVATEWRDLAEVRVLNSSCCTRVAARSSSRSEEHTSELQSQSNLVCRLLLEKKNRDA